MPRYNPPTKVATKAIPFIALVSRVDPNWNRFKHWEIQYEFTRRVFFADPYRSGPYAPSPPTSGTFTLGQSTLGGPDVLG